MDFDREMLSTIKDMAKAMEDLVDTFEDITEHLEDIKNQFKGVGESGKVAGDGMAALGGQIQTVGDIGSSAFGGVGDLIKSVTGESSKATSAISGMFSLVKTTGAAISFAPALSNTKSDVDQMKAANAAYVSALKEAGNVAGLELVSVSNTDRMIDQLDKLWGKTSLTVTEQQTYNGLIATLKDTLPEVIDLLDQQNDKYQIRLDLLRNMGVERVKEKIDAAIEDAEKAAGKRKDDLEEIYNTTRNENVKEIEDLREDLLETPIAQADSWIEENVTKQIRDKYNLDENEELNFDQKLLVERAKGIFRTSKGFNDFVNNPFWKENGLSSWELSGKYGNWHYKTVFDLAMYHKDSSRSRRDDIILEIREKEGEIDRAYVRFKSADTSLKNGDYIGQGINLFLSDLQLQASVEGADAVKVDDTTLKAIYSYGYGLDENLVAQKLTPDFYQGMSGAEIMNMEMDSDTAQGLWEFAAMVLDLQTIQDYRKNNETVDQQSINNAMLDVKDYLPENVDINRPNLLTNEDVNNMLNQYFTEHPDEMEALYDLAQKTEDLLDPEERIDWIKNATTPIYQMCQKQPTVTLELAIGTLKTLGALEEKNSALGWTYFGGGRTWVGEHGPEILDLPPGSKIYSHSTSKNMMQNSVGGIVTNNTFYVREEGDIEKVAEVLAQKLRSSAVRS